jgi:hypothetical protein
MGKANKIDIYFRINTRILKKELENRNIPDCYYRKIFRRTRLSTYGICLYSNIIMINTKNIIEYNPYTYLIEICKTINHEVLHREIHKTAGKRASGKFDNISERLELEYM